jgi:arylsulfatase A-like enzyme
LSNEDQWPDPLDPEARAGERRPGGSVAYHDVMIDHDKNVGAVLAKLDELGIADNTIVMYGTDNGPHALRRT